MGTWGVGLYSSDDALDLRASVGAVCRLPYGGDELVDLLAELNPEVRDPNNEGHSTFWLVVADQFQRRGIRSIAQERALQIIADGTDLAMLARLGMAEADLQKRKRLLESLADELRAPPPEKSRKVMKKPQALLFGAGDILAFRIDDRGNCYNPYLTDPVLANFEPVGWDGCMVVASGLALEYLAWYHVARTTAPWANRPTLEQVVTSLDFAGTTVGTMSKNHVARMGLELLGTSEPPKVSLPSRQRLVSITAQGISIADHLSRWLPSGTVEMR